MNLLASIRIPENVHDKVTKRLNKSFRQITVLDGGRQLEPDEYEVKGGVFDNPIITIKGNLKASQMYTFFYTDLKHDKLKKLLGRNFYSPTKRKAK